MPPAKPAPPADATAGPDAEAKPAATPKSGRWTALTNLSLGRGDDKEKLADVIHKGETVTLTEEQAHGFLTRHRVPVIRPAADQGDGPAPGLRARDLFGRPPGPPVGARPDPPRDPDRAVLGYPLGATQTGTDPDPRNAPEANDPKTDLTVDPDAAKDR